MSNQGLVETVKSVARAVYFGLLGVVALILTVVATSPDVAAANVDILGYNVNVGMLIVAGVASLAKVVDRYRHTSPDIESKGIAPSFLQQQNTNRQEHCANYHRQCSVAFYEYFVLGA